MKLRLETLTILFLMSVILLAGCTGCGQKTAQQAPIDGSPKQVDRGKANEDNVIKVKLNRPWAPCPSFSERRKQIPIITDVENIDPLVVFAKGPYPTLPRDLAEHLDTVHHDGNSYYNNPNFWQEVYDKIDEYLGLDIESTVKYIVEHKIYTEVILKYLEDYDAFRYVVDYAPLDQKEAAYYIAQRIFAKVPRSTQGLEAGLFLADVSDETARVRGYRAVLEYHPNSIEVLYNLSRELGYNAPEEAIPLSKRVNRLDPSLGNFQLGLDYERLGDYKTAWVYFQKELKVGGDDLAYRIYSHLDAYKAGWSRQRPIASTSVDPLSMSFVELSTFMNWAKSVKKGVSEGINPFLAQELKAHLLGQNSSFEPDRLARAFEYIHRFGHEEGLVRLESNDPELATKMKAIHKAWTNMSNGLYIETSPDKQKMPEQREHSIERSPPINDSNNKE